MATINAGSRILAAVLSPGPWLPMTLINTWTNYGAGYSTGQYRLVPLINEVEVIGNLSHASTSGNSVFWTIPAGFIPASNQIVCATGSPSGAEIGALSTGSLEVFTMPAATTLIQFHGWYSMDA
jgi:hypothetical protein